MVWIGQHGCQVLHILFAIIMYYAIRVHCILYFSHITYNSILVLETRVLLNGHCYILCANVMVLVTILRNVFTSSHN